VKELAGRVFRSQLAQNAAALYGAFAIIVGVVFGTLSVHPF